MEEERSEGAGGRPAVGNVLGFSLLLRDRLALLRLERRALYPGVRLLEYEAEVPDVEFPLRAQGAAAFRRRRCRARQLRLEVEPLAIAAWVSARLLGRVLAGLRVDEVELDPAAAVEPEGARGPCLLVSGEHEGRRAWVMLALQVQPQGRKLAVQPWRAWRMGEGGPEPETLWRAVIACLHGAVDPERPEALVLDPVRHALLRPFVEAGWRVPELGGLFLHGMELGPERAELSLGRRGEGPVAEPIPRSPARELDGVSERLRRIHAALADGERPVAFGELERLADALPAEHPLRLPALRWLAHLARHHDPVRALQALRGWLHVKPRDKVAARALVVALGTSGRHRELAKRIAAECRLPNPPVRQARLELALGCVLVDRLDDVEAATGLLEPLSDRCATEPRLRPLELSVRAALARAFAARSPATALGMLSQALALAERGTTKADVQAGVAAALARHGHHREAAPLWREAVRTTPHDAELVEQAVASVRTTGDTGVVIELLRATIPQATAMAALPLRRTLVSVLLERGDPTSRELARAELRSLVREHPEARELASELASLEPSDGRPPEAASRAGALAEGSADPEDRARVRLEQARLLAEISRHRDPARDPVDDPELVALHERLLALDGDDVPSLLLLGARAQRDGDDARARPLYTRALERLPVGDPRRIEPCVALARLELAHGSPEAARDRLTSVLGQRGVPREAYSLLAEAALALGDATTRLRALRGLIAHAKDGPVRLHAELELARQLGEIGRSREGLVHAAAATRGLPRGTDDHIDAARTWLSLATAADDPRQAAAARLELRQSLGSALSAKELRAEALLLAERLDDPEGARKVIEVGLAARPGDELLLSTLRHLVQPLGSLEPYLDALEAAVDGMVPGTDRDRLASELALSAAEAGDAPRTHRALERMTLAAGDGEDLLDLRDWAVQVLGLRDQELRRLDERLRTGSPSPGLLQRLTRLVGEGEPLVEHLLAQARQADPEMAVRLSESALALAERLGGASLWMRAMRLSLQVGARDAVEAAWSGLLTRVSDEGEDAALADLVALADDARAAGVTVDETIDHQLDEALARHPSSPHLHRALARHLARPEATPRTEPDVRAELQLAEHVAHLEAIAERHALPGVFRADLFVGMTEPLDRRAAAELLASLAMQALADGPQIGRFVQALEARQCWPEVLRILRGRVDAAATVGEQVATLKHLAHVTSEVLGDTPAAVGYLEAALTLAPTDPDLLLPLLDHHFTQTELRRAVELTERVLEHVRMGDAAFAALAHRAADAAIAQGQPEHAQALLERIAARLPDDAKARARLQELHERTDEPVRRVALLAAVATRQSGQARIEALEERARLLLDPLDRPREAMEDLAAVAAEAPDRQPSVDLLVALYREHGRFMELVELREAELPRRHGPARARLLAEIATLYRDELHDLPRAEQALRLALEQLGGTPDELVLADELREALAADLERQGRVVELAAWLEQELAAELEPRRGLAALPPPPPRLALLQRLARLARERLDDEPRAARIYEQLERWRVLPDEGLATLARWHRRHGRHEDLVRVLQLRALALPEHGERRAAVDMAIAELLDGPLARPHDAAPYYLAAYLADPDAHPAAGTRARVLLSAVDSVTNVRDRLLRRLPELPRARRPALITLLADLLAPHEGHEDEAEARYHEALALDDGLGSAHEGLGRLLGRRGRKHEAALALVAATERPGLPLARVAEAAALAAKYLIELARLDEAEVVLRRALARQPDSPRALLELARLYERSGRPAEHAAVLDQLAQLPLPGAMLAEVAYRRALLLQPVYDVVPSGPQGERARSLLLEALGANPRHAAARQALLALASTRREWSIVAHMHYLAIRELPPGVPRASVHLELAATYLDHLGDPESAMRNIESALQQAATDVVVVHQTGELARRMPDHAAAADRFEAIAAADNELEDAARARLWLLAADLRMEADDHVAAEADSRRVLDLLAAPQDATATATRTLERLESPDGASLSAASADVLAELERQPPPAPPARARLLARLHDLGVALDDPKLVERATREQLELAQDLDESDAEASTTGVLLHDLLAARGEYGPVVQLYERLATRAGSEDPARAARVLVEAAGLSWRGDKQPAHAASLLGRALALDPGHEGATRLLGELVHETTDPATAGAVQRALGSIGTKSIGTKSIGNGSPALRLQLAMLATTRGDEEQALAWLRPLAEPGVPEDVRFEALARLEAILAERGEPHERRLVLEAWFELALGRRDARAGDLGLELARLQRDEGDRATARRTSETARRAAPEHRDLLRLQAELAEQDEDWAATASLFEELARLAIEDEEQAEWLKRAAMVYLRHPELAMGSDGPQIARRLLLRAAEIAPRSPEPRAALVPLAFAQGRWDEVLELAEAIVAQVGHDEEVLGVAALVEAYRRGERRLAREIGFRHPPEVVRRVLLPALQQVLGEVAMRGPLPRLDAILGAGSSLLGGRSHLFDALSGWAAEQPPEAGLSLGLARLLEARGSGDLARHCYQLAAFVAPRGPVPALAARLPSGWIGDTDLHAVSTAPMEGRSMLREVLAALRDHLTGLGTHGAPTPATAKSRVPEWWPARVELCETIVEPWRAILGVDLPIAWTEDPVPGGVAVRNDRPPRIVLGRACAAASLPELTFRLASATAGVALGLVVLETGAIDPGVLLDALGQLANPAHQPTGEQALALADELAIREARHIGLTAGQRTGLLDELAHWLTTPGGLVRLRAVLRRARMLLATRLGSQLDGALLAIARDHGLVDEGRVDAAAALGVDDAMWLLRALSLR